MAVVNARISDRSWPRYRASRVGVAPLLRGLAVVLAQTDLDATAAPGAGREQRSRGGKSEIRCARGWDRDPLTAMLREHLAPGDARAGVRIDAGRRRGAVAGCVAGWCCDDPGAAASGTVRRGRGDSADAWGEVGAAFGVDAGSVRLEPGTVFLLDSIGELASVYSLAQAAFIGGSLVAAGGHNPLEAAQFGVPIVMGPSYENFRGIVEKLREHDAIRIVQPSESEECSGATCCLAQRNPRRWARRAREVFESEAGATERAVAGLLELLKDGSSDRPSNRVPRRRFAREPHAGAAGSAVRRSGAREESRLGMRMGAAEAIAWPSGEHWQSVGGRIGEDAADDPAGATVARAWHSRSMCFRAVTAGNRRLWSE